MDYVLILNTALNSMGLGLIFFGAARTKIFSEDLIVRVGLMMAAFGLMGQVVRNLQYFATGFSPSDVDLPFWALKDLGIVVIAVGYALRGDTNLKPVKRPLPKTRGK